VLLPLIVVSCFTVSTLPHEGQLGGSAALIEFSGIDLLHRLVDGDHAYDTTDSSSGKHYAVIQALLDSPAVWLESNEYRRPEPVRRTEAPRAAEIGETSRATQASSNRGQTSHRGLQRERQRDRYAPRLACMSDS